jgi:hypothetical protein
MSFLILRREEKQTGPVPASGVHAELLAELNATASALIKLIELERSFEQGFWTGSDSVLNAARQLVRLAEQRAGELRDAGPR